MTTPAIRQHPCAVEDVRFVQSTALCPRCGAGSRRVWDSERVAIDASLDRVALLLVRVSVHRCEACARYFRLQPPFLRPDAIYTNRVVRAATDAVFRDGMAFERVPERLARDLRVRPSAASIRGWCRTAALPSVHSADYAAWVVASFSGVLCLDEVYEGRLAVLLAVYPRAPAGDRLVGYELIDGPVEQAHVERFLLRLREAGLAPVQVVTDGSALYPTVLAKVWPRAAHQLCLFHETQSVLRTASKIVASVRSSMPKPVAPSRRTGALRRRVDPNAPTADDRDARIALVLQ